MTAFKAVRLRKGREPNRSCLSLSTKEKKHPKLSAINFHMDLIDEGWALECPQSPQRYETSRVELPSLYGRKQQGRRPLEKAFG